jgi:menaquinone-specific isochorismate synthase
MTEKKEPEILEPIPFDLLKTEILRAIEQKVALNQKALTPGILRIEFRVNESDPLAWLQNQPFAHKTYWCDRKQDFEIAGAGKADLIYNQPEVQPGDLFKIIRQSLPERNQSLRYYGGLAFDVKGEIEICWKTLGNLYFILPRFELIRRSGQIHFAVNILARSVKEFTEQWTNLQKEIDLLNFSAGEKSSQIPVLISLRVNPERTQWFQMIQSALEDIEYDRFKKIVLARRIQLEFTSPVNAFSIISKQKQLNPDNIHFLFQPDPDSGFMGSTPELLYARQIKNITTEAIAGTRSRGADENEDKTLEQELFNSSKDIDEHGYVVKSVQDVLKQICRTFRQQGAVSVLKQARVQHLHAQFQGNLKPGIADEDIIAYLHPTPAVGGFPTGAALFRLKTLEPFNRGWYAGPVGWIGSDSAKFAVAIRSGLIGDNNLFLYSGAGIVKGSEAEAEWQEINNKIAGYLKILGIPEMEKL